MNPLYADLKTLTGIGDKKAQLFASRGVKTIRDLLHIFPKSYQTRTPAAQITDALPGTTAIVVGKVLRAKQSGFRKSMRLEVVIHDLSGILNLVFFHRAAASYSKQLQAGQLVTVVGQVSAFGDKLQMVHPRVVTGDLRERFSGLAAIYPEMDGVFAAELPKFIAASVRLLKEKSLTDPIPLAALKEAKLYELGPAYERIHLPPNELPPDEIDALRARTHPAYRRIAFDEVFGLQLAFAKTHFKSQQTQAFAIPQRDAQELFSVLFPFLPTQAQTRTITEITNDLAQTYPMARLLQGDVGSGKTAVAASACLAVAKTGFQSTLMVPTEILAEQHFQSLRQAFEPLGICVDLITSSLGAKGRKLRLQKLAAGETSILVGTHALISQDVEFKNLALCIIDEQHRFGVEQRETLKRKAQNTGKEPHLLVMTATPIPRSLALTAHGNLALSIIDELPPGRQPISTHVLKGRPEDVLLRLCEKIIAHEEQAYVIYPLVEESEKIDLLDCTSGFASICAQFGEGTAVLLHGRMNTEQKNEALQQFARGEVLLLISTTVVEVGVNIPNATNMVVMHAERFGLSQLHQLRGRVGRGEKKSRCYLIVNQVRADGDASKRLQIMEQTNDGFVLAQEDLSIRGPGDLLGTKQAGLLDFNVYDLVKHADLVEPARKLAFQLIKENPQIENPIRIS